MLLITPALAGLMFFLILQKKGWEWRLAVLGSATSLGVFVWVISEGLSLFAVLTPVGTTFAWVLLVAGALVYLRKESNSGRVTEVIEQRIPGDLSQGLRFAIAGAVAIGGLVLVTALVCPPHTWDAMVYHLPRAVMWISNQRVDFYPTPDYEQLIFAPWAEYDGNQRSVCTGLE